MEGATPSPPVFLEPVQNSGGCLPSAAATSSRVREICNNDVLLSPTRYLRLRRLGTMFGSAKFD